MHLKERLRGRLLAALSRLLPWYARVSYSQFGEDVAAHTLFKRYPVRDGFYVDVGAYHPAQMSNTYLFYQAGWSGITIEPTPGTAEAFRRLRPRDLHLTSVVNPVATAATVPFYCFREFSPYNTLSEKQAQRHAQQSGDAFQVLHLPALTLTELLDRHVPRGRPIDLLCIDCEGADTAILATLDWSRFAPKVLIFEDETPEGASPLQALLAAHGYQDFAHIGPSKIVYRPPAGP